MLGPLNEKSIFLRAIALESPDDRRAFLDEACRDNPALRSELEALVSAHDRLGNSPPHTIDIEPVKERDNPVALNPGAVIAGRYKVLEPIGEGGMGSVWMAEQREPVKRLVALKVIKPGMDSKQVMARFEAERQALAVMDHPNIAKVLDGGTTEQGTPFFVMELVKGVPITNYCDEHHLGPRQRLDLFVWVCQAVQHAHQKGVIHRDIKPSNVLVAAYDGKPVPKVIDFGVAKAIGQPLTEQTLVTGFGGLIGTLEYMSPEQAEFNALDIDTRSDVYALGVLLYELLTGTTPLTKQRLRHAAIGEALRLIREEEPPKPSTRLSESKDNIGAVSAQRDMEPAKLTKLVRGELDWIVMKALEKDRNRRYETANGFAMDVQRYLADEPVAAGPPSAAYRFRKFARRNSKTLAALAVIFVVLVAGIVGTSWGMFRAMAAERDAVEARGAAERQAEGERLAKLDAESSERITRAVLDFVKDKIFSAARPKNEEGGLGHNVPLRQAIEAALPFIGESFTNQPLVEGQLRLTLGTSFWYLGERKTAAEQYKRAWTLFNEHRGPAHVDTIRSTHNLAMSYAALDRRAEALKLYEDALAALKATLGPDHHRTLLTMHNLADLYYMLRRHDEALKLNEETRGRMKATLGVNHPDTLMSMNNLGNSYAAVNRLKDAVKLHEETLPLMQAVRGPDHSDTLSSMTSLANIYGALDRHQEALKLREKTVELREAKLGREHPETLKAMNNLAHSYAALERHEDALKLRKETFELRKKKLGPDASFTLQSMHSVASSLMKLDRGAEAIPIIDECVQRSTGNEDVDPHVVPWAMDLRLRHFEKSKDAAGCRATAEMWEKLNRNDPASLFAAARMRSVTAAVLQTDQKTPAADAPRLAREQADAALALLTRAVAAGFKDPDQLKKEKDLDPLRSRDEFKKLLAEIESKDQK